MTNTAEAPKIVTEQNLINMFRIPTDIPLTPELTKDLLIKHEMMCFCNLEIADLNTRFININYGENGRTCVVLGPFGFHARMKGQSSGVFHDEKLNLNLPKDIDYDLSVSCKREFVFLATVVRKKLDVSADKNMTDEQKRNAPEYIWDLIIKYTDGDITLTGLAENMAVTFKKMLWAWMTYHNDAVATLNH